MTEEVVFKEYPKIYSPYKRHTEGPKKNQLIVDEWTSPEYAYLALSQWIFTEKIDGCFPPTARVLMADGSWQQIQTLVKAGYRGDVLGRNADGQLVPTKVTNTFNNGKGSDWLKVSYTRRGVGRGNHTGVLTLTPNHRVYSPEHSSADAEGYLRADELKVNDPVWVSRSEAKGLSHVAKQVLIGKMLGDGTMAANGQSANVQFSSIDKAYTEYTLKWLGTDLCSSRIGERISGYGSQTFVGTTVNSHDILDTFDSWFEQGHKEVPKWVAEQVTPLALAFWYMDDGTLSRTEGQEDRATFSTHGFNHESQLILQDALSRLGVGSVLQSTTKGTFIRINSDSAEVLFSLIAPYISPSMQYKLPERWRGVFSWPQGERALFKAKLVQCVVSNVEAFEKEQIKYDLETELHNYVVNGVVVHNCNIRILWDGHKTTYGGRTDKAQLPAKLVNWLDENLPEELFEQQFGDTVATLYGEGFGAGIQKGGGNYSPIQKFVLFDVRVGNFWLQRDDVSDIAKALGIEIVPRRLNGNLFEAMRYVAGGIHSSWGDFEAEGLVGVTAAGLLDRAGRRIQVKVKTKDFAPIKDQL